MLITTLTRSAREQDDRAQIISLSLAFWATGTITTVFHLDFALHSVGFALHLKQIPQFFGFPGRSAA